MTNPLASRQRGFTVLELIVVAAFLAVVAVFLFIQRSDLIATNNDTQRKTAVNAFYYSLEKVYYPQHNGYPQTLTSSVLPSVDPKLFTDTNGKKPGDSGYEYRYSPIDCQNGLCQHYTLSVNLQKEAEYVKKSDH